MRLIRTLALLAALGAALPAAALERFSYCGTIQLTGGMNGPWGTAMPAMPAAPPFLGGYVGPTGITPMPPRSCAYVILGERKDGHHTPAIVVWSDVPPPAAYHADIYSDAEGIFGHRQNQPSDYEPSGLAARNREMEAYLDAAAGEPVLKAALEALREGRTTAELERTLPVPAPLMGGAAFTMPVRYRLTEIRADAAFPPEVERLIALGRERRKPHSSDWRPIRVPASWLP